MEGKQKGMLKGDGEALSRDWNVLMGNWRELESIRWRYRVAGKRLKTVGRR